MEIAAPAFSGEKQNRPPGGVRPERPVMQADIPFGPLFTPWPHTPSRPASARKGDIETLYSVSPQAGGRSQRRSKQA